MKLGLVTGYSPADMAVPMDVILEAENLGFDSVWTSEAWGSDAVTPAAWILARTSRIKVGTAIIQMGARAPSCAAMTAMTLDAMSGGRFILGVGPSGPQVIEGWYGVPYGRPLARTREYISIIRKILARTEPLTHEGVHYQIPYRVPWKGTVPQRVRIPPGKLSLQPVAIGADDGGNDIVRSTSV